MLRYLFKSTTGSFGRTIGRFIAYMLIFLVILLFGSFITRFEADALEVNYSAFYSGGTLYTNNTLDNSHSRSFGTFYSGQEVNFDLSYQLYGSASVGDYLATAVICVTSNNFKGASTPNTSDFGSAISLIPGIFGIGNEVERGNCQVNGYPGKTHILQYPVSVTSKFFKIHVWAAAVEDYDVLVDVNSMSLQPYTEELKQQIEMNKKLDEMTGAINKGFDAMQDAQQQTNQKLEDMNNTIKDDNVDDATSSATDFFTGWNNNDFGLTDVVMIPLDFIKKITTTTCTPLKLPAPFVGHDIVIPCISKTFETHFPDILKVYRTVTFGIVSYWVCINTLAIVRGFKDPDSDEIEVLDL